MCWDPGESFSDPESGVLALEWQLAHWVRGYGWDTLLRTQRLTDAEMEAALQNGTIAFTPEFLTRMTGIQLPLHGRRYRLGLRALNKAGRRSCGDAACTTGNPGDNWAVFQGTQFGVDILAPTCTRAVAWLCDPLSWDPEPVLPLAINDIVGSTTAVYGGCAPACSTLLVQTLHPDSRENYLLSLLHSRVWGGCGRLRPSGFCWVELDVVM